MRLIRLYVRVMGQLGSDLRLGALLTAANVALAVAAFAEPVLFGRIIDRLTHMPAGGAGTSSLLGLVALWVGFGLFSIGAGVLIALHADRLTHRSRLSAMANYFEHVLDLPLAFHSSNHSGRVLKAMLEGTSGMAATWLGFFRDHCAALVSLVVLLPMTLFLNWQLGSILVALMLVFTGLTTFVLRRTETLQGEVEAYHSGLAAHASDALGNVAVIQSFTRAKAEKEAMHGIIRDLLAAQTPVLSWWALASVATRASATLTMTAIFVTGIVLHGHGLATVGDVVSFMSLATMLVAALDQVVAFVNSLFLQAPKMQEFFDILDTVPASTTGPAPRRWRGSTATCRSRTCASYDGRRPALDGVSFSARAARPWRSSAPPARASRRRSACSTAPSTPMPARSASTARTCATSASRRCATTSAWCSRSRCCLPARSARTSRSAGPTPPTPRCSTRGARPGLRVHGAPADGLDTIIGERGRSLSGGERARPLDRRALLKNPPVLILDEATSALDATTERKLQGALEAVMEGRTTLRDRPPPGDDPRRRPHPGLPRGPHRRERHLRRTGGRGRPLRRPRPGAVHGGEPVADYALAA